MVTSLVRSDHPSNTKQGGVAIYYEDHLWFLALNMSTCWGWVKN